MEKIRNLLDTDSSTAGDPMSQHRWTHQSAEKVARYLAEGFEIEVSATVVRRLLGKLDYSLKSNKKCLSSGNSPDRDKQFGIIKSLREEYVKTGDPIVSVDTKKKELIGLFKNPGRTWRRRHKKVKDHDFRSEAKGLASPYGIYDPQRNFGVLVVGESADTPEFAVNSILTWWKKHGQYDYPHAKRLLILADSGGSNGARPRMWKKYLQEKFADETGLTITVAHYPAGASKWNPIEHRMFNEITKNWAGHPLETFDTVVNFARNTGTKTGLRLAAYHDKRIYEKGKKASNKEMDELALTRPNELEKLNYTIEPRLPHEIFQFGSASEFQSIKDRSSSIQTFKASSINQCSMPFQININAVCQDQTADSMQMKKSTSGRLGQKHLPQPMPECDFLLSIEEPSCIHGHVSTSAAKM